MEEDNFIHLLVKNLQMLCHDHLQFKQSLEITGHVCIHLDGGVNLNLFLNEKCNKVNTSSVFTSLSFQAPSLVPADTNTSESLQENLVPVKESVFAKKNTNKRLFIDDVKKIGKPNYNKPLSGTPSSIIVQVKKVPKSDAGKIDENAESSMAVAQQNQPFVEIVKLEHLTGTAETDISVKQTEREKYEKGNILIESMVDDDGNQIVDEDLQKSLQDEDDMERMHADPGHVDMIDEAKEIPGNDDDDDDEEEDAIDDEDVDDDQITDCGFGEINITYRVNDVSELPSVNKKRGKSVAKIGERDFDEPYKKDLLKPNYSYFDQDEEDDGIEYTIVDMATKKGRPMLIDNIGFGYNIRRNTDKTVHWTCSLRNKQISCAAGVLQCNDKFKRNKHLHCHPPKPGLLTSTIIVAEARAQASNDPVTPTSLVVQRAMTVKGKSEDETFLPRTSNLKRMINRYRQCKREGGIPKKKARTDCVKVENLEIESQ